MYADPYSAFEITPSGGEVSNDFTITSLQANSTVRRYFGATDGEPTVLKMSHSVVGSGASKRDRHLVRLESYVVVDEVEDLSKPISIYAVADIPQAGVTSAQLTALWAQFVGLLLGSSGSVAYNNDQSEFFDRWVQGES